MKKLTNLQWAIMLTVKQEPGYVFVGSERAAAERLVKAGLLEWDPTTKGYVMTEMGNWTFAEQTDVNVNITYIQK